MTFDTRCTQAVPLQSRDAPSGAIVHAHSPKTRPQAGFFNLLPVGPEFNVIVRKPHAFRPHVLLLSLAVTAALTGCPGKQEAAQPVAPASPVEEVMARIVYGPDCASLEYRWEDTKIETGDRYIADDAVWVDFNDGLISRWREYWDSETPKS